MALNNIKSKIIAPIFSALIAISWMNVDNIYAYSVPTIEGGNQSLSAFEEKKIFIVTLPITQNLSADSFLVSLDSIAFMHRDSLKVIGVPSFEDGFTSTQKNFLIQWFRTFLNSRILITDGLKCRKSSQQQNPLFQWLTKGQKNGSFDFEIEGPLYKFMINKQGELYAVLRTNTKISGNTFKRILNH